MNSWRSPFQAAFLVLAVAIFSPVVHAADPRASYDTALSLVLAAKKAHCPGSARQSMNQVTMHLEGTFDLTARLQGRSPFKKELTPISERITIDKDTGRVAYDVDWFNYQFSQQNLREVYDAQGRVLYVDKRAGGGGWSPSVPIKDARERYKRYFPQFLLADAVANRQTLRDLGRTRFAGRSVHAVGYVTANGDHLTLYLDRQKQLLIGAATIFDMEILGDTEMRWSWSGYRTMDGHKFPNRLRVHLAGVLLKDVSIAVELTAADDAFEPPEGIEVGAPPEPGAWPGDFVPWGERAGKAREIEPGVYLLPNLRPGFHLFFVEFDEFVLAVDAPTGWYEMQQIPPMNFLHGDGSTAFGKKYIRTITQTVPDKPIRYVALTHHHSDHIGGVRAFVDEGAIVLGSEASLAEAKRAATRSHSLEWHNYSDAKTAFKTETVSGVRKISDGKMEVHLIPLPSGNPKAEGFFVVYLPKQKILYFTSFLYPVPEDAFPVPESVPLSLWFVRWLDQSGLDVERIYNVHGQAEVADWQLERFRDMLRSGEHEVAGEEG